MIDLKDVTLISVSSVKINETLFALNESRKEIKFAETIFVTHEKPIGLPDNIRYDECEKISNINAYNYYVIYDLSKHVNTKHCLLIHYDGYIVRPHKWDDAFLKWDYIGSPWPIKPNAYIDPFGNHIRVGNGGFSLRSKKLLDVPSKVEIPFEVNIGDFYKHMNAGLYNEDGNICVHNRHIFEELGCKFAPVEVAAHFAQENDTPEIRGIDAFGFHKCRR